MKKNYNDKQTQKRLRKNIHSKHIYSKNIWILFLIECETTPLPWFIATYSQLIVPIIFHILQNCYCEAFLMTLYNLILQYACTKNYILRIACNLILSHVFTILLSN